MAKILLIEDDNSIATLYKTAIEVEGHTVDVESDGQNGLNKALTSKYDLVILDIVLPNISGLDILKNIKENESTKDTKVVMLTNYGQQENVKRAYDAGALDVFLKYRMTPSETSSKVNELIGSKS
jgi:DNA-binding response OmpR family regulator